MQSRATDDEWSEDKNNFFCTDKNCWHSAFPFSPETRHSFTHSLATCRARELILCGYLYSLHNERHCHWNFILLYSFIPHICCLQLSKAIYDSITSRTFRQMHLMACRGFIQSSWRRIKSPQSIQAHSKDWQACVSWHSMRIALKPSQLMRLSISRDLKNCKYSSIEKEENLHAFYVDYILHWIEMNGKFIPLIVHA